MTTREFIHYLYEEKLKEGLETAIEEARTGR